MRVETPLNRAGHFALGVRDPHALDVNRRFAAMVSRYLFEAEFCNPAPGWEKGQIDKAGTGPAAAMMAGKRSTAGTNT